MEELNPFGLVMIESMASGTPVIAMNLSRKTVTSEIGFRV
jgi:glycosyltransferase involved in cell wall biosynthesis